MAITKLLRLKESIRGSPAAHLKHNLFYICDPDKCEGGIWTGGNAGTRPEIIYQTNAFAVHNDQQHMHEHITFDSVSRTDGYKFHSPKGDWEKRIQPITDRICKKYGLPVLEFTEEKRGKSY